MALELNLAVHRFKPFKRLLLPTNWNTLLSVGQIWYKNVMKFPLKPYAKQFWSKISWLTVSKAFDKSIKYHSNSPSSTKKFLLFQQPPTQHQLFFLCLISNLCLIHYWVLGQKNDQLFRSIFLNNFWNDREQRYWIIFNEFILVTIHIQKYNTGSFQSSGEMALIKATIN